MSVMNIFLTKIIARVDGTNSLEMPVNTAFNNIKRLVYERSDNNDFYYIF